MGHLLERAREMSSKNYWKPDKAGEGIEGVLAAINKGVGKFNSTDFVIKREDGQLWIISVPKDSVLAQKIADDYPEVNDSMAVLYLGVPNGKKYKNWRVVVEHTKITDAMGIDGKKVGADDAPL
jgi:hypothetical protein